MNSKWKPGTRVRVKSEVEDCGDMLGTVEEVSYASWSQETSILLDEDAYQLGAHFHDDELEEVTG
ncbi:hypothetical protein [Streptomyces sp. NPDC014733]|uniref:hypothetical protein n=1 Tax=Streptomyces sp. NPDC014733 TaxID=3364885 RepID=UPI0036FEF2AF